MQRAIETKAGLRIEVGAIATAAEGVLVTYTVHGAGNVLDLLDAAVALRHAADAIAKQVRDTYDFEQYDTKEKALQAPVPASMDPSNYEKN